MKAIHPYSFGTTWGWIGLNDDIKKQTRSKVAQIHTFYYTYQFNIHLLVLYFSDMDLSIWLPVLYILHKSTGNDLQMVTWRKHNNSRPQTDWISLTETTYKKKVQVSSPAPEPLWPLSNTTEPANPAGSLENYRQVFWSRADEASLSQYLTG